ncbi:hypothetical protein HU200_052797 [Digitaria exilis]|uniref:Uncharacterized protein n=1 Tax=Digitaria exilis TaxID=1010633 RepID=A0A835AN97_9POAL|nr:hypothetical protein HU200_052797 [Digitaria exilis]
MGSLLLKLGALLSDEYRLLTRVKSDIMFLKCELESMYAFLKQMSEVEDTDEQSKCWMKEVRELSYDIEDIIDSFMFSLVRECPLHLQEVSNEILKKCGGMPLAIITISSLLATKARTKEEWEKIWKSIGVVIEKDTDMEEMNKILSLGYNDLYLSVFPEDYEIKRDRLIRRWIAEGFITTEGGQDMEEIGECYFNDLVNRSMIQPVGIQYDGRAEACRVHDMILDLITSKSVEENFVTLCGDQNQKLMQQDKIHQLSLNYYAREDIMVPKNLIVSNVRSLTTFGYSENMPCLSKFQLLRVLDLENRVVLEYNYLKHIGKLFHLSLELPEGIGNLQALRELSEIEINRHTSVSSLLELGSLTNLRILGINWNSTSPVGKLGQGLLLNREPCHCLKKLRVPFNAHGMFSLHGILDFGIQCLSSLKHLEVEIVCHGARLEEVEAIEEAVKKAASYLSDELSLEMRRWDEEEILKDGEHILAEEEFDTYHLKHDLMMLRFEFFS